MHCLQPILCVYCDCRSCLPGGIVKCLAYLCRLHLFFLCLQSLLYFSTGLAYFSCPVLFCLSNIYAVVLCLQACIWIYLWWTPSALVMTVAKFFFAGKFMSTPYYLVKCWISISINAISREVVVQRGVTSCKVMKCHPTATPICLHASYGIVMF